MHGAAYGLVLKFLASICLPNTDHSVPFCSPNLDVTAKGSSWPVVGNGSVSCLPRQPALGHLSLLDAGLQRY